MIPTWLRPVEVALERAPAPVDWFIRDDDGGWDDARLLALLDVVERHELPVDVAMIPAATTPRLAGALVSRMGATRLCVHQHGHSHHNHERDGRRCEFGPSRALGEMARDVERGRGVLAERFGDRLDAVFTPPWNRCVPELAAVLVACGIDVLSRDVTAGPLRHPGLAEVAVNVDWFGGVRRVRWTRDELGVRIAEVVSSGGPVGLMLHHAVTPPEELEDLGALLGLVARHRSVRPRGIAELAAGAATGR